MDNKPPSPPIEPQNYLSGLKVIDIGDLRISRGLSRRPFSVCEHKALVYDSAERRIWCRECECDVDPFDAFRSLVERYSGAVYELQKKNADIEDAKSHILISLAAKNLDKSWRKRSLSPTCPHCMGVLLPEDFSNGITSCFNTEMERQRRKAKRNTP